MKNFSVPGSYILGKTVLLDGLEGGLLTILLSWLYYDSFLAIPFLIPLVWFWHKERENVRREKRQELFRKMFREWILLLASSLTAGYSMENALVQSYQELCLMFPKGGIMQEELKMMLAKAGNNQRPEILFDELAEKYKEQITVGKYNVDDYSDLSSEFGIRNIPTILLFKDGEMKERIVGSVSKDDLEEKIKTLL